VSCAMSKSPRAFIQGARVLNVLRLPIMLLALLTSYGLCGVLAASVSTGSAAGPAPDPLSVVRALMDAERAANLDAAMTLFATDAFILNVTGWKTADREELRWFINKEIWMREDFGLNHHRIAGNRVSWDEAAAESFYQTIGVAPVQFVFEATVKSGKIKSIIAHLPAGEIARISKACRVRTKEPLIHGRPCSEFVRLVEAHTRRHLRRSQQRGECARHRSALALLQLRVNSGRRQPAHGPILARRLTL